MRHPLWSGWLSWLGLTLLNLGFFLGSDSYFFFLLCVLMLVLPALSLLALRLGKRQLSARLEHDGDHVRFVPEHRPCFPIGKLHITFETDNRFTQTHRLQCTQNALTLDSEPGMINVSVKEARMYDCLHLFCRKLSCDAQTFVLQVPAPQPETAMERVFIDHMQAVSRKQGEWRDKHEVREYRQGDSLKWIHQKLSYKCGKLMVREFENDLRQEHDIRLELSGEIADCARTLSRFRTFAAALLNMSARIRVSWYSGEQLCRMEITDENDLSECLVRILSHPRAAIAFAEKGSGWLLNADTVMKEVTRA